MKRISFIIPSKTHPRSFKCPSYPSRNIRRKYERYEGCPSLNLLKSFLIIKKV
jgi:hypothetical protein